MTNAKNGVWEMWCIVLCAIYGCVLGGIIGIGTWIIINQIPIITSQVDPTATMLSHIAFGLAVAFVWGVGLGGTSGAVKAILSRGENWSDWFRPNGKTVLGVFPA